MRRTLIRNVLVGTTVVAFAVAAASALAASSNRGGHFGVRGGFGPPGFGFGMLGGGPGGPGMGGFGLRGGGGGLLGADLLTPAAGYLGVSLSDLQADLKAGKTLAQEATAKGKTASGLVDALVAAEKKVLDSYVAAGWLTDTQETNQLDRVKEAITHLVNDGPPVPLAPRNGPLQTAAAYLGVSVSDLLADLQSGKTLAQEATAKGKTADGLVQALLAPLKTDLDKRVTAGDITSAQETAVLNRETQRLTDLVNNTGPGKATAGLRRTGLHVALQKILLFRHR